MRGVIDRRMLINYRCEPSALARLVPSPFKPKIVNGFGMAGICLIRLRELRPRNLPAVLGLSSENAAHRIAVEWEESGEKREGVFIPRRDTNSRLNALAGSRVFPGRHHLARFEVQESSNRFQLDMRSNDDDTRLRVVARVADEWPAGSMFSTQEEASAFFAAGSLGWSTTNRQGDFDGLELRCAQWRMEPLFVEHVESSFFANPGLFPPGTVEYDSALLMRGIQHEWHRRGTLSVPIRIQP